MASLFADSLIKKIPDGWISTQLGRCLDLVRNGLSLEQNQEGRGVRVTRIETISEGKINVEKVAFVETKGDISEYRLESGDVLFSHINSIKHIGKVAQFNNNEELYHGMNLLVLRFNSQVDKRFGYYFLASRQTKSICERMAKQAVNQASINTKEIRQLPIALPPLPEQRKIAEILSTVDETIENTDAIIQETQQLKKGLMQKLFTEGIGHTRFKETKIGKIPEDWELLPFDDCVDKEGHTGEYRKLQTKDYLDEGRYPIIDQGQEFIAGYTNDENDVYTGSLPVTIFGDHTLFVKFVNMKFAIGADGTVLLYPNKNKLTHKFFYYLISNHKIKSEGYQRHVKYLKQKWFAIPPLPEQRKIADILSEVDAKIETERAFKLELEKLKNGLMQVLLTGKVRVKV